MKKASKICLLIGGILGIVLAVTWFALTVFFFVWGGIATAVASGADVAANVRDAIYDWAVKYLDGSYYTPEQLWTAIAAVCFAEGVLFLVMMLFAIPAAVISFILRKKEKTGLPLPIVLAVLSWSGNIAAFAGAALAIVNWAIFERKEGNEEPKAVEQKEEEKAE